MAKARRASRSSKQFSSQALRLLEGIEERIEIVVRAAEASPCAFTPQHTHTHTRSLSLFLSLFLFRTVAMRPFPLRPASRSHSRSLSRAALCGQIGSDTAKTKIRMCDLMDAFHMHAPDGREVKSHGYGTVRFQHRAALKSVRGQCKGHHTAGWHTSAFSLTHLSLSPHLVHRRRTCGSPRRTALRRLFTLCKACSITSLDPVTIGRPQGRGLRFPPPPALTQRHATDPA